MPDSRETWAWGRARFQPGAAEQKSQPRAKAIPASGCDLKRFVAITITQRVSSLVLMLTCEQSAGSN